MLPHLEFDTREAQDCSTKASRITFRIITTRGAWTTNAFAINATLVSTWALVDTGITVIVDIVAEL